MQTSAGVWLWIWSCLSVLFPSFSLALMISLLKCTFMITPDLPFPGQWPPCNGAALVTCALHTEMTIKTIYYKFIYGVPKEWSSMGGDRPFSPGQSNDLQPAFAIVPCVFLPASEDSQVTQSPIQNTHGPKALEPQRATESDRTD